MYVHLPEMILQSEALSQTDQWTSTTPAPRIRKKTGLKTWLKLVKATPCISRLSDHVTKQYKNYFPVPRVRYSTCISTFSLCSRFANGGSACKYVWWRVQFLLTVIHQTNAVHPAGLSGSALPTFPILFSTHPRSSAQSVVGKCARSALWS